MDADFTPFEDLLTRTVGFFENLNISLMLPRILITPITIPKT
ncbi:hypothetical protein [Synechococcus sp. PCC 6312]|nr:hypothetical protein [Synechococcus sp. PCC 6312]